MRWEPIRLASGNTANGASALLENSTGSGNTANGNGALGGNNGNDNTANGYGALFINRVGNGNTADGVDALERNDSGNDNTAIGDLALNNNATGSNNTAVGTNAGSNATGSNNTVLGSNAGYNLHTGNDNIDIGNIGGPGDSGKIRIGTVGTQNATFVAGVNGVAVTGSAVLVNSAGQLGVAASSARFKEAIKPMDKTSEAILVLKPVTFCYKKEFDPSGISQFGLVAEDVEKINPALVVHDKEGKPYTVRYEAVNMMLLNEFLKEHRKVQEQDSKIEQQEATITELKSTVAQQQKQIEAVTAGLQKVSAQLAAASPSRGGLEVSKFATGRIRRGGPAPQVVNNP